MENLLSTLKWNQVLNTLPEFRPYSTKSYPTTNTNEIEELCEDINLLKQTIESQKVSFHEKLKRCNEDMESDSNVPTSSGITTRS